MNDGHMSLLPDQVGDIGVSLLKEFGQYFIKNTKTRNGAVEREQCQFIGQEDKTKIAKQFIQARSAQHSIHRYHSLC